MDDPHLNCPPNQPTAAANGCPICGGPLVRPAVVCSRRDGTAVKLVICERHMTHPLLMRVDRRLIPAVATATVQAAIEIRACRRGERLPSLGRPTVRVPIASASPREPVVRSRWVEFLRRFWRRHIAAAAPSAALRKEAPMEH